MKTITKSILGIASLFVALTGCKDKTVETRTYTANIPVYITQEAFEAQVSCGEAQTIEETGKIYLYGDYIFINKPEEGVHIIDNADPSSPQNIGFITIPGNTDVVVKNNTLYANSRTDLIALDITNMSQITEVGRFERAFPDVVPDPENNYPVYIDSKNDGVIVGWITKEVSEEYEYENGGGYYRGCFDCYDILLESVDAGGVNTTTAFDGNNTIGVGGSMASMTLVDNNIYSISNGELITFSILNPTNIIETSRQQQWRTLETLFPYRDNLFIGTTTGMLIYDVSSPGNPSYVSVFNHFRSCDPVVVEGDIAYVTLRSNNLCGGENNQLDVIDISDISNPIDIASYDMTDPHGLGIDNNTLFICDGNAGLKVFDATDKTTIDQNLLTQFENINAFDVIPMGDKLFMIGSDGLYQYDYSNPEQLTLLSHIVTN